jgi:putative redox protein
MAEAKITWKGNMLFEASNARGHNVLMDSSKEHGGNDNGFFPSELLLSGIGGCTAMDVVSILKKKQQDVQSVEVIVKSIKSQEPPVRFTDIELEYVVRGSVDEESLKRAIELSQEKYCVVGLTVKNGANFSVKYRIG